MSKLPVSFVELTLTWKYPHFSYFLKKKIVSNCKNTCKNFKVSEKLGYFWQENDLNNNFFGNLSSLFCNIHQISKMAMEISKFMFATNTKWQWKFPTSLFHKHELWPCKFPTLFFWMEEGGGGGGRREMTISCRQLWPYNGNSVVAVSLVKLCR